MERLKPLYEEFSYIKMTFTMATLIKVHLDVQHSQVLNQKYGSFVEMPSHNGCVSGYTYKGSLQCVISDDYLYQDVFSIKKPCHINYNVMAYPQGQTKF